MQHGYYSQHYRVSGKIKMRCEYANDKLDGEMVVYSKSGNVPERIAYKNGMRNGIYTKYSKGNVVLRRLYRDDKIIESARVK